MEIIKASELGFCFGVKRAIKLCYGRHPKPIRTFGEMIHNSFVVDKLKSDGIVSVDSLDEVKEGTLIIRSHGAPLELLEKAKEKGIKIEDGTCPFVQRIRNIVREKHAEGYIIAIFGKKNHPEIIGINSETGYSSIIFESTDLPDIFYSGHKIALVAQTTADAEKYRVIVNKIKEEHLNLVDISDTICYTTHNRQNEAFELSKTCDGILVIGDSKSSNTMKLLDICMRNCPNTYLVENMEELIKNNILKSCAELKIKRLGIIAGASTPNELITEVIHYMSGKDNNEVFTEAKDSEFLEAVEQVGTKNGKGPKKGKIMKVTVTQIKEDGLTVSFGQKVDGFIQASETSADGSFNPADFEIGSEIEAECISDKPIDGLYHFSKKIVDQIRSQDKIVDTIRNGEEFSLVVDTAVPKGLLGKLGSYTVFIPASHIKEKFVTDTKPYVGKTLRLVVIDIDDKAHKIIASQKNILIKERQEKEEIFWNSVVQGVIVSGKVKNITSFGVFVSVDGFDCLVRLNDISWARIKSPEDVLQKGKKYDFLVLSADREKGKVQLGYKQLQKHPFELAVEQHPVGSTFKGKITSILSFGAFVQILPGVEGLIHVSEASNVYVKDINDVFKVGDEVEVKVLAIDSESRKFTLSAKACMPAPVVEEKASEDKPKEEKKAKPAKKKEDKKPEEQQEWDESSDNNIFADLLKDIDLDSKKSE